MKQLSAAPIFLMMLALASCNSSSATPREDSTATAVEKSSVAAVEDPKVSPDATLLEDFKGRVERYVSIRKSADDHTPPLKKTENPAEIKTAQEALAKRIGDLRVDGKHGEIFTPEISAYFKRLLRPEVKDPGTKESIKDDNPDNIPYLKVNAVYPDKEPLSTVPPNVLAALPPLPDDIEYRFVGKHVILRDVRANLIIDYIPNAVP